MWSTPEFPENLVTFTEETLNGVQWRDGLRFYDKTKI